MNEAVATSEEVGVSGSQKLERALAAAGASVMIAGGAAVWYFDPTKAGFFPTCPLYSLTGFACPGCGLTRGFHALFHGDVLTALDYNALLPGFGLMLLAAFVSMTYFAIRGNKVPVTLLPPTGLWIFFYTMLAFGVLRNLPWFPFVVLFP
jgi:hypothetical protein